MALEKGQKAISIDTLYKVEAKPGGINAMDKQLKPSLFIDTGAVDVYGYNGATKPTALTDMKLTAGNTAVEGLIEFNVVPNYIALVQNGATAPTEIVLTGVIADDGTAIS